MSPHPFVGRTLMLSWAACFWPVAGYCANWSIDPRVEVGGQTDDNYRLLPSGFHDSVSGLFGDARFDIHTIDPVNELRFTPGVHATWFPSTSEEDSTDPYAEFFTAHHGERTTASMQASYIKQTVVRSNLAAVGTNGELGNPDSGDAGYIAVRNRQQLISVAPTLIHEFTPRDSLNVNLNYTNASYDRYIPNFNVGYAHYGADIAFSHAFSERQAWLIHGLFTRNDPDEPAGSTGNNSTANAYGLMGEWRYRVTDVAQAYVRAGGQRSQFSATGTLPSRSETTYIAGAGVNWNYQITRLFLDLTRTVDPSSTGYSIERNQLRFQITRNLTPLVSGFVAVRALSDKAADTRAVFRGRNYGIGSIGLEKRFLRQWSVRGQYNYTYQDYKGDGFGREVSNMFELSVVYEPRRETASVGRYQR